MKVRFFHSVAHKLFAEGETLAACAIARGIETETGIEIHPGAKIGKRFFIDHGNGTTIGETAEIGDNVMLSHGVVISGIGEAKEKRHPTIGNNENIGAYAQIWGPVDIGDNVTVGPNSVVEEPVASGLTVKGSPPKAYARDGKEFGEPEEISGFRG